MKGLIFRSFLEYAEDQLGLEFVDNMLQITQTDSQGVYTNIGTYDHAELIQYIGYICENKKLDMDELVENFGVFLFGFLGSTYPNLIKQFTSSLDCIYHIDQTIHKNVTKIYPNAELPNLNATFTEPNKELTLTYESSRPFMYLALGLIKGCIRHYKNQIDVKMIDLSNGKNTKALFTLKCQTS